MIPLVRSVWAAAVITAAVPAYAQSLGEVSRQEEARRAAAKKAVITLSNANLRPAEIAPPSGAAAPAESCYMSIRLGRCVSAEEMVSNSIAGIRTKENAPTERRWRQDAESIRSQIEKTQGSIATLLRVVADEGRSASERKVAEQTLAAARLALAGFERQWQKLETDANNKHVPHGWIEPLPTLTVKVTQ